MKSFVSVEELEGEFAVCELELLPIEESKTTYYSQKETKMVDIPMEMVTQVIPDVSEGDIIVVMHDGEAVESVCYRDNSEKERRIELIKAMLRK